MDDRIPDLEGTWFHSDSESQGDFKMFIDKKTKKNDKYLIIGEITDDLGTATFQGTISRKFIKFVKMYDLSAMGNNGASYLYYKAKWVNSQISQKDINLDLKDQQFTPMFYGVYLYTQKGSEEQKKHINMLIETFCNQTFEIKIINKQLKQDLIDLKED